MNQLGLNSKLTISKLGEVGKLRQGATENGAQKPPRTRQKEVIHKLYSPEAMNQVDGKYEAPLEEKEIDTTAFLQKYKKLPLTINEH
ncbi:unnamed protein product [Brassica oleracea var. botrytis]